MSIGEVRPAPGARHDGRVGRSQRLGVAVVGTGFVGPHHVDAVRRGGYGEVVALVGSDASRTASRAASLGVPASTTDLDEVLRDPAVDVVHVCTPNHTHVELGMRVLDAGKHLVMEKPVALDSASAARLAERADERGLHAAVAMTYRGYPMVSRAREMVAAGSIGQIRLIHGAYLQDWLADETDYNWRLEPESGGASRAVADIGTHWLDTAEYISGQRVVAVLAELATFIPTRMRPAAGATAFSSGDGPAESVTVRSEDAAVILLRFEDGARGATVISQVSPGRKNAFTLEIAGSRQSLGWEQELPERLWIRAREESRLQVRDQADARANGAGVPPLPAGHPEGWSEALRDLLRPFYAAIASGEPVPGPADAPYPTLHTGVRGLCFVEAVLASAGSGEWTNLAG